jgi:hypothetical protein
MKAQSISPIGRRLMSMKDTDYVTAPCQIVLDVDDSNGETFSSRHVDERVLPL